MATRIIKKKGLSEEFATLLYNSFIPNELKSEILAELYTMDQDTLKELYHIMKNEKSWQDRMIVQLEVELNKIRNNTSKK